MIKHSHRKVPEGKYLKHGSWYEGTNIQLGKKTKQTKNPKLVFGSKPYKLKPDETAKIVETDIESATHSAVSIGYEVWYTRTKEKLNPLEDHTLQMKNPAYVDLFGTFNELVDVEGPIGGQEDIVFQKTCEDMFHLNQISKTGQYDKVVQYFEERSQGALFQLKPLIDENNFLKVQFESFNLRFAIEHYLLTEARIFNRYASCLNCDKPITLKRRSKKFCSNACRMAYNRKHKPINEIYIMGFNMPKPMRSRKNVPNSFYVHQDMIKVGISTNYQRRKKEYENTYYSDTDKKSYVYELMYWKTDDIYGDLQLLEKELKKEFVQARLRGEYYQKEYFKEISAWIKNWLNKNKTSEKFSTETFQDAKNIGKKMEINEYENKRFIRTDKAISSRCALHNINRWQWIADAGSKGRSYSELNTKDSIYRKSIKRDDYSGNITSIIQDIKYDIKSGWIKAI